MVLPILAYGDPVLKKKAQDISPDYPELSQFISNMWETMYASHGVGLAAPQVGESIRLFVVDASGFAEDETYTKEEREKFESFKRVFINPSIIEEEGDKWAFEEGCLSIPDIREEIFRKSKLLLRYQDENFVEHEEEFDGISARIIQHEYDHIEGVLFTDYLSPLRKRRLKRRLMKIAKGEIEVSYKMRFPMAKKARN
ncbi:MAG TPA: peptide deformylase [Flavobacteriales bacterium]|jgi:peptide deformylase|nr:peptide deformylase [Salibacteraceae bacterium]HAS35350.1 peptide deformylase [Flavobacteriales bacterium]